MNWFLDQAIGFFVADFPAPQMIAFGGPPSLAWSFTCLWFAGWLKRNGIRTGYTRKVFHFLIFGTVAALQWRVGTPAVCLFGGLCTLVIFFAVWRGAGNLLYEAIAREKTSYSLSSPKIMPRGKSRPVLGRVEANSSKR